MGGTDAFRPGPGTAGRRAADLRPPGGLLDALGVAPIVLDATGRIALWSPQAEALLGYTAGEALGRYAAQLLVTEEHLRLAVRLFARVMGRGETWAGALQVRHKDGSVRLLEFRNIRLQDVHGDHYALGLATDRTTLRRVERDLALSVRLVEQSPIGLAVLDTGLRYVAVNPALERLHGIPAADHLGRTAGEVPTALDDTERITRCMRQVLDSGVPVVNQQETGRTRDHPDADQAWSVSFYRLEDPGGRVLGLAASVVDVTERHRAAAEAERARRRLALIADSSVRIGTTLDLETTARELADLAVPQLADIAAVDVLDAVLSGIPSAAMNSGGPARFRALAVSAAYPSPAVQAADQPGGLAVYSADRLVTRCVRTRRPVHLPRVGRGDLPSIARDPEAAQLLSRAGIHSYLAVPLIARGEVLGALDLKRARNPLPFDDDDVVLASELAARAAVCVDNARWYRQQRDTALILQRSLLPKAPPQQDSLEVAFRYQPAGAVSEVGGDWFDILALGSDKIALVVGDVMGSGINAATAMGQLRTATRTLAGLDLDPDRLLRHLDKITTGIGAYIATCLYAVYDPHRARCCIAGAGHLPPVLVRPGRAPALVDLPTGVPLGVGGVPFRTTTLPLAPGDELVLYTDGLVETRDQDIDTRLDDLLAALATPQASLEETCDRLLLELRSPGNHDDVALLVARVRAQDHPD
ncbi:PAS sensor protein [Streptomyces albus subsp. albus]|nr:PAS sensor protein [Streptomyces albus subsp. albus]